MIMTRHYLKLRQIYAHAAEFEPLEVRLDELADGLECTPRNVIMVLKRMGESGWLEWKPRRGRGNRSTLTFIKPVEDMALRAAQQLVEKKDLKGALEQIQSPLLPTTLKETFHDWLYSYFGYTKESGTGIQIDSLRFPMSQPIYTLDPIHINYASESHLVSQLFDSLVRRQPLTGEIEPHLAHAWETNRSRTEWTFYLRKGILFHHGREMKAQDAAYSLNRLRGLEEKSLYRWIYNNIEEAVAADPTTLTVRLKEANELFLPWLCTNRASVVPEDVCEQPGDSFERMPVGTGPFKLTRNDHTMCTLEAFPFYFQGRAHLDRVEIWKLPNLNDPLRYDKLDSFQIIHNFRLPDTAAANDWNQVKHQGTTCKFVTWNMLKTGPLSNTDLRKAFFSAVNRNRILDSLAGDVIYPADGFLHKSGDSYGDFDPAESIKNLQQAGYEGETLALCTIPQYEKDAELFASVCREVGLNVEVTLLPLERFKGEDRLHYDLILFSIMLDSDTELRLIDLYQSISQHSTGEIAELLDDKIREVTSEPSTGHRTKLLLEVEKHLKAYNVVLFLYQKHLKTVYHPSVKGISLDSLEWVQFKDIWFKP
ncbi:ABC transporter substrate-binding protein [Paenibacillus sp. J2TS4]|uniref:ABC transporter substrate-binding protein n=1 Tax=Paenibacillus sp. J2TS4 TaxID=2807194 RepID=UPI001B1D72E3|nr:ABC transporter substrate-binding protein [Paenibacillus sp. J2TS4]GIP36166.1 ABC transporter substrate-binding protein [Paenibacillus sp. J2TS4]